MNKITQTLNKQTEVSILGISNQDLTDEPMDAINWFNLKNKFVYTIYNLLALPMARSVGARPIFKGYRLSSLEGPKELAREVLLLVRYPGPKQFLHLVSKKLFQLVSILRIKSVKDFNFGFFKCLKLGESPVNENHEYLVGHFQAPRLTIDIDHIRELCSQHNCQLFYLGGKIANLSIDRKGGNTVVPLNMGWMFLISSDHRKNLTDLYGDPEIRKFLDQNTSNYLGIFSRVR